MLIIKEFEDNDRTIELEAEIGKLREAIEKYKLKIDVFDNQLKEEKRKKAELSQNIDELKVQVELKNGTISCLDKKIKASEVEFESNRQKVVSVKRQNEALRKENAQVIRLNDEFNQSCAKMDQTIELLNGQLRGVCTQLEATKTKEEVECKEINNLRSALKNKTRRMNTLRLFNFSLMKVMEKNIRFIRKIRKLKEKYDMQNEINADLEEIVAKMEKNNAALIKECRSLTELQEITCLDKK